MSIPFPLTAQTPIGHHAIPQIAGQFHREYNLTQTRDLDVARDYMSQVVAPHRLTLSGPRANLSFRHSAMELDIFRVHLIEYATEADRVEVDADLMAEDVMLKIPLSGIAQISQGKGFYDLRPGQVFLTRPNRPFTARLSGDYSHLSLQIAPQLLLPSGNTALDFDNEAINASGIGRMLTGAVLSACHMLTQGPLAPEARVQIARAQAEMLRAMLLTLPRRGTAKSEALPYYLHRAEAYMRANLTEEIELEDLVRVSGVSRRSLHAGFRRFRDTTPMKRFKDLRLAAAHEDLQSPLAAQTSVTDIATRYNFFQLSKFSRDFQALFGALPSQVKARRSR